MTPFSAPLALSTGWRSRSLATGRKIIDAIARLGITAIELDYRLDAKRMNQTIAAARDKNIALVSLHAVLPAPSKKARPLEAEAHSLSAPDEETRRKGVADVANTLRRAKELSVGAVVIHPGALPMERVTRKLHTLYDRNIIGTDDAMKILNTLRVERLSHSRVSSAMLMKSMDELAEVAESTGVSLGLENRYHLHEQANFEELAIIFLRLAGSKVGYWHDTGHAQVQQNLGIIAHETLLQEFSERLVGIHLHDVDGYTDHLAPLSGGADRVDFAMVARYVGPEVITVLEYRNEVTDAEAERGVNWYRNGGGV